MDMLLKVIESGDVCSLIFLIGLLSGVGWKLVECHDHLRRCGWSLATGAFVVYCLVRGIDWQPMTAEGWLCIVWRGLLAGALVLGVSWIALRCLAFAYQLSVGNPFDALRSFVAERQRRRHARRQQRRVEYDRRRQQQAHDAQAEAEDRRRQQHAEREEARQRQLARCQELRLECELLYSRHAQELALHLPPERFEALLDCYFSGLSDPAMVRKRARMIKQMLTDCAAASSSVANFESLQALAEHFQRLRQEIEALPYDDDTQQSLLGALASQEDNAIEEFLKR